MGLAPSAQTPSTVDPTVFVDDDGQAYLHYGGGGRMVVAKLKTDMITLDGRIRVSTPANYRSSPYLIKHDGTYFEIYASKLIPTTIDYATSSSPLGPWTQGGRILDAMPASSADATRPPTMLPWDSSPASGTSPTRSATVRTGAAPTVETSRWTN